MNTDIRLEDYYWHAQHQEDLDEAERIREKRQRKRNASWMKWAKRVLMMEMAVILFEAMYQFGCVIRGYNSFGGESLVLIGLIGFFAWQFRHLLK